MTLRVALTPMPAVGLNSLVITSLRVAADSAPLPLMSQAAVSVNEPSNCWYVVFSSTVIVWLAPPVLPAKLTGVCCCRPRVTVRPPLSLVVVR
jgi:hypothetical protein